MESLGLRLLSVVALVLANAFFVAAEFALVAARRTRIEAMVRRGDRKARTVQAALQDLYRQLSAAQLGITVASILLGYVSEDTVAHLFRDWFAALPPLLDFSPAAAWRPRQRSPSCRSCTSCSASRLPKPGRSPMLRARAAGSRPRSSSSPGSRGRSPISSTGAPGGWGDCSASRERRPSSSR